MTDIQKLIELAERCRILAGEAGVGGFPETEALLHEAAEAILALTDRSDMLDKALSRLAEYAKDLATARNDALEEAARLAEQVSNMDFPNPSSDYAAGWADGADHVSNALVALQTPAPVPPAKPCTCHPDDNPPWPCPQKYALSECRAAVPPAKEEK